MIIFSTMFYVSKSLTKEVLVDMANAWISESPHYNLGDITWDGTDVFERKSDKQKFELLYDEDEKIIAIRLENIDVNNVIWTNDFVLEERDDKNKIIVRLARDAMDKETQIQSKYNRPRLMKSIIKLGYGDKDGDLLISDKALVINEENIDMAEKIVNGKTEYLLPIVYVTRLFDNNDIKLDVKELAKDLAGTAHVLVEEDTRITSELKELTDGKNPFNGAVHIYFSDKVGTRLLPEDFMDSNSFRNRVVNAVCRRLSLLKLEDKYTWSTIRYKKLLSQYSKDKQESDDLEKTYEEILKLKEQESSQLIDELENEINDLRTKVQHYEALFQFKKVVGNESVNIYCNEKEFYEGEIKDMIMDILIDEKNEMEGDPNQEGWRKYHVLKSIVENNRIIGNGSKLAKELKSILSRIDRINAKDKKRLRELGFVIKDNKHNKLYFCDDNRYSITLGKTPGDCCASDNAASIAISTIVCSRRKNS